MKALKQPQPQDMICVHSNDDNYAVFDVSIHTQDAAKSDDFFVPQVLLNSMTIPAV